VNQLIYGHGFTIEGHHAHQDGEDADLDFATDQAAENGIELNCRKVNFQQISEEVSTAITRSYNILTRVEVIPGQPPITRFLSPAN